jgi:ribonuclease BN (tRNA processing enzyme)
MQIQILGAHATEAKTARSTAILVDDILALDAGGLCSSLTLSAQLKLNAVLLTHYHYDHVRDIPFIAMNIAHQGTIDIYSTSSVFDVLSTHLFDGVMYPDFRQWPQHQPAIRLATIEPHSPFEVKGYSILAIPVSHSIPSVGFQVTSPEGKRLFYTGDTGGGLSECWNHVSPDLLITELTLPQKMEEWAKRTGHLTPKMLKAELAEFRKMKGHIPPVILIHLNPLLENEIAAEVAEITREIGASITLGREGMKITL